MFASYNQFAAPLIEPLERRQLLCGHGGGSGGGSGGGLGHHDAAALVTSPATDPALHNGIVSFKGGSGIDWMFVFSDPTTVDVQVNGVDHVFDRTQVKGIQLDGAGGDDTLMVVDDDGTFNIPVTMNGGAGNDDLEGGSERDYMNGGPGNDVMFGNGGDDVMLGGDGNDVMNGGDGNDTMMGGRGDDQLGGGAGDDYLYGNAGNDSLYGESGNDHLSGGRGTDMVEGDGGADIFSSKADSDAERIMDDLDTVVATFARPAI
jgi:Ca2+-binding RTX toxin-like protein